MKNHLSSLLIISHLCRSSVYLGKEILPSIVNDVLIMFDLNIINSHHPNNMKDLPSVNFLLYCHYFFLVNDALTSETLMMF